MIHFIHLLSCLSADIFFSLFYEKLRERNFNLASWWQKIFYRLQNIFGLLYEILFSYFFLMNLFGFQGGFIMYTKARKGKNIDDKRRFSQTLVLYEWSFRMSNLMKMWKWSILGKLITKIPILSIFIHRIYIFLNLAHESIKQWCCKW